MALEPSAFGASGRMWATKGMASPEVGKTLVVLGTEDRPVWLGHSI